jgi:hypothetical protein
MALAGSRRLLVDPEHARFVTVERQRLSIPLKIFMSRFKIRKRRLGAYEQHHHQSARGIVNVDQCRARRSSILKPPMIAAVDLDQFAKASPATPGLLNLWRPKSPRQPQSAGDHQRSHGLNRQVHAMAFSELLSRQCWSKIRVR